MLHRELWTILAHCYNAFVAYSVSLLVIHKGKRIDGNKVYYIYTLLLSFLMANIFLLTLFRIGLSGAAHGCWVGRGKRAFLPKICHTYPTMMKFSTVIPYINKIKKTSIMCHTLTFCWHHHFFTGNQQHLLYQKIQMQFAF